MPPVPVLSSKLSKTLAERKKYGPNEYTPTTCVLIGLVGWLVVKQNL